MRIEELEVSFSDGLMLLPVTVEHTIDEKSPLHGHNHETLMVRLHCALRLELCGQFQGVLCQYRTPNFAFHLMCWSCGSMLSWSIAADSCA